VQKFPVSYSPYKCQIAAGRPRVFYSIWFFVAFHYNFLPLTGSASCKRISILSCINVNFASIVLKFFRYYSTKKPSSFQYVYCSMYVCNWNLRLDQCSELQVPRCSFCANFDLFWNCVRVRSIVFLFVFSAATQYSTLKNATANCSNLFLKEVQNWTGAPAALLTYRKGIQYS
jgi:hypothetical protein